jgi:hypothetical protein
MDIHSDPLTVKLFSHGLVELWIDRCGVILLHTNILITWLPCTGCLCLPPLEEDRVSLFLQ